MSDIRLTKLSECGGCAAKVGAGELRKILTDLPLRDDPSLIVGYDRSDDASIYKVSDSLAIVQTVDFFPPLVDDPFLFGEIAAVNALSDIYAMGGVPKTALNIMAVPEKMPKEDVHEILRGGYTKVYEAEAVISGGHSIYDEEPKYGLAVTGFVDPSKILKNTGAVPGDVLIYTKPIGTGVMLTAAREDLASKEGMDHAVKMMTTLNRGAADVIRDFNVHACTDITGFGMLGHILEMAEGSGIAVTVNTEDIVFYEEAGELAKMGILPKGMYRNRSFAEPHVDAGTVPLYIQDLLYDPQTSGGLLVAVPEKEASALLKALRASEDVPCAVIIGTAQEHTGDKRIRLL